jgi:predicted Zn-dependent peptidase
MENASRLFEHRYDNGVVLLAETMPWLRSAAFSILLPAGCQYDPANQLGLASLTSDMIQRGCGPRDNRQFVEDLEMLGADYGVSVSVYHTAIGGTVPSEQLAEALAIFADVVREPRLPPEQLEDARMVCRQEIRALEDDLARKAMLSLRMRHYGDPLGRGSAGTIEGVDAVTIDDVRRFCADHFRSDETIISIAGNIDWESIRRSVGDWFGGIPAGQTTPPANGPAQHGCLHIPYDSQQTHICLAFPSVAYRDPDYFRARGAVGVMSDGLSSRLFDEVREKRGLCYSIFATLHSLRDRACILCYAGTGAERAQETLNVIADQFRRLPAGITRDELGRLKVQIRSSMIMQQESSRSRAATIAGDWFHLGRIRSLEQVSQLVNDLTIDEVNGYLNSHPTHSFDLVTLGPAALEVPNAVP